MDRAWRPKTYTSAEAMLEEVRLIINSDARNKRTIALKTGVSPTTVGNIVSGKTRWPRQTTLFPLLSTLGYQLTIVRRK
jgi:hypothetical protein